MSIEVGHASFLRRVAIVVGAGYVPGMNSVVMGAALAAGRLGWEMIGIRDGFDGCCTRSLPDGGLRPQPQFAENLDPAAGAFWPIGGWILFMYARSMKTAWSKKPTCRRSSEEAQAERIDALIAVVGGRGMSIFHKLHRKGLNVVCIPRSIENDIAATAVSFGFNSALSFTIEMLDKARQAAQSARKIGVIEVLAAQAGWLALQAGIAVWPMV
jgi:6-phosphofructokinase 1